jgi:hypothetical protein
MALHQRSKGGFITGRGKTFQEFLVRQIPARRGAGDLADVIQHIAQTFFSHGSFQERPFPVTI